MLTTALIALAIVVAIPAAFGGAALGGSLIDRVLS